MLKLLKSISIEPVVLFYVWAIFAEYDVIGDLIFVNKCINHLKLNQTNQLHICTQDLKNNNITLWNTVSTEANNVQQIYNGLLYATSIISSFIVATYADRRSKLLPILIPIIGSAIVQIIIEFQFFVFNSDQNFPLILLNNGLFLIYLCSIISGITGGTSTLLSSCFAHVTEKCDQSQRTSRITIVEACLFGGGFFGFTIAGAILRAYPNSLNRYKWNFGLFLLTHLSMLIYTLLIRKQFHKPEQDPTRTRMDLKLLLTSVFHTINKRRLYRNHRFIIYMILLSFTLISFWNVAITTTLFIYTRHVLSWETWKYSYFSSAKFGVCGIFLCLLPVLQFLLKSGRIQIADRYLNQPLNDGTIITIGLLSRASAIIMIGLSSILNDSNLMIVALITIVFAEYPIPAIRSMISKLVEPNEKAQMFAVMAAIQSICFFTGGIGFLALYNAVVGDSKNHGPGWIFISMGIVQLISMFIFWIIQNLMKQTNGEQISITNNDDSNELSSNQ